MMEDYREYAVSYGVVERPDDFNIVGQVVSVTVSRVLERNQLTLYTSAAGLLVFLLLVIVLFRRRR